MSFSMQSWQCLLKSLHSVDPDSFNSPGHSLWKLLKHWFKHLYLVIWTIATRFCMEWPIMSWGESSRCRMLQHASSLEPDVVTTLRRCYVNYTGFLFGGEFGVSDIVRSNAYLMADDIHLVSERNQRSLRSSSDNTCVVPRTRNSFRDRSFGAVGWQIWNSLSCGLRALDISYKHFKALLKTYMFG